LRVYTVHEPPHPPAGLRDRAERLVFVREGFSWAAALFGPLWMLAHRMWVVLIGFIVLELALEAALAALRASPGWMMTAYMAIQVAVGFEAAGLRRWTLARKGWRMIGSVTGDSALDCERRFIEAWLAEQQAAQPAQSRSPAEEPKQPERRRGWLRWPRLAGART
jgi:hypothetical protein